MSVKPEVRPPPLNVARPSESDHFWAEHPESMIRLELKYMFNDEALQTDETNSVASRAGLGSWIVPSIKRTSRTSLPGIVPNQPLHQDSGPGVIIALDASNSGDLVSQLAGRLQRVSRLASLIAWAQSKASTVAILDILMV